MPSPSFALFRLPNQTQPYMVVQGDEPLLLLPSVAQLNKAAGFVVAPFYPTAQEPVIVIQAKATAYRRGMALPACHPGPAMLPAAQSKASYAADFNRFHAALCRGEYQKLVLSRQKETDSACLAHAEALFCRACKIYPHQMIALVSTPQSGTWLMATPETLLECHGHQCHTMALAGTMPLEACRQPSDWSDKNRQEQALVANYIAQVLAALGCKATQGKPHTTQAARLAHLCSDFSFQLPCHTTLGRIVESLHPTPAVCGLPKAAAQQFIRQNESHCRSYYSGFMGPYQMEGHSHLFVSLRCMRLNAEGAMLYSGGGILPESTMESEWRETEEKMKTIAPQQLTSSIDPNDIPNN